jgi:hypothetical protein
MSATLRARLARAEKLAPAPATADGSALVIVDRFFKDNLEEYELGTAWIESTQASPEERAKSEAAARETAFRLFPPLKVEREQSDDAAPVYVYAESLVPTDAPINGMWRLGDDEAEA